MSRTLFPLGEMRKPEVREEARQQGLTVLADKPDSQEICFVPGGDYKAFLDAYMEEQGERLPDTVRRAGDRMAARCWGGTRGFTTSPSGQRKGLGVGHRTRRSTWWRFAATSREVVVGGAEDLLVKDLAGAAV